MVGNLWPDELRLFSDLADKYFSDADESQLYLVAQEFLKFVENLTDILYEGDGAYDDLENAYKSDGKPSDALKAVQDRHREYKR